MPVSEDAAASRADRFWLAGLAAALALILVIAWLAIPTSSPVLPYPSSYSPLPSGTLAACRLLRASGSQVRRWRLPLSALPPGAGAVLVLADPILAPPARTAAGQNNWAALLQFLRGGGTVLATGASGARMIPGWGGRAGSGAMARFAPLAPGGAAAAGPIQLRPQWTWPLADARYVALYGRAGRAVVVAAPVGRGRLILWATARPLTNAGLRHPANLALLLSSLGPRPRSVLWDEYFHGVRQSWTAYLGTGGLPWVLLPLALALAAGWLTYGRRWLPPVSSPAAERDAPMEFAIAVGALYERAGAADLALTNVRQATTRARHGGWSQPGESASQAVTAQAAPGRRRMGSRAEQAAWQQYRSWAALLAAQRLAPPGDTQWRK